MQAHLCTLRSATGFLTDYVRNTHFVDFSWLGLSENCFFFEDFFELFFAKMSGLVIPEEHDTVKENEKGTRKVTS